jgi:hypothetical protein
MRKQMQVRSDCRTRPQTEVIDEQVQQHFDGTFAHHLTIFLAGAQKVIDDADLFSDNRLEIRSGKGKYIAIDRVEYNRETGEKHQSRSTFCFVAAVETKTRGLGHVKQGDVMKPATYSKPAKHARGNIFDTHYGLRGNDGQTPIRWTGPHYVK